MLLVLNHIANLVYYIMDNFERLWGQETAIRVERLRTPYSHSSVRIHELCQSPAQAQALLASELGREVELYSFLSDVLSI